MSILLEKFTDIRDHWFQTASGFADVLPKLGGRYFPNIESSLIGAAALSCSSYPHEVALRYGGTLVPVVPLIQTTEEQPIFWLGWREEWRPQEKRRSSNRVQFRTTAITVYFGREGTRKRQLIRAEWTGAESYDTNEERYIFQSDGAAHPHWHVDGLRGYFEDMQQKLREIERDQELRRDLAMDTVKDFGTDQTIQDIGGLFSPPSLPVPDASELAWTDIHLAANAKWADDAWAGSNGPHDMHAIGPNNFLQIRRWLISCARYLQTQIQAQLARRRQ